MSRHRFLFLTLLVVLVTVGISGWSCADEKKSLTEPEDHVVRLQKISGDRQTCDSLDTLDNRFVVQLDSGENLPLRNVYLSFRLSAGYGQTVAKPTGEAGIAEVRVPTDILGRAYINFLGFRTCEAKVKVTVETIPDLEVEFTVNPEVVCQDSSPARG